MQSKRLTILLLLLCVWYTGNAQTGFYLTNGKKRADIPFEFVNNFIVITLNFNGKLPLRFIYDTGAEHTILNKREIGDFLGLSNIVRIDIPDELEPVPQKCPVYRCVRELKWVETGRSTSLEI